MKRNEIKPRIERLRQLRMDPCQAGYNVDYANMDLGRVRLCFELVSALENETRHIARLQMSNVISTNKQKMSIITREGS